MCWVSFWDIRSIPYLHVIVLYAAFCCERWLQNLKTAPNAIVRINGVVVTWVVAINVNWNGISTRRGFDSPLMHRQCGWSIFLSLCTNVIDEVFLLTANFS